MAKQVSLKVAPEKRLLSLKANYKAYTTVKRNPFIDLVMDLNDPGIWYGRLKDFGNQCDEFKDGEFIIKLIAPAEYPYSPADFQLLTPNGVYTLGVSPCISIGKHHAGAYPAILGMGGFANEIWNGLINWELLGSGIAIINTTKAEKKVFARESKEWNKANYPDLVAKFDALPPNRLRAAILKSKYDPLVQTVLQKYLNECS